LTTKTTGTDYVRGGLTIRSSAMPTLKEHRQRAKECLELANTSPDLYVKMALVELAKDFSEAADRLETNEFKQRLPNLRARSPH
jgi:hypothetical protein